MTKYKNKYRIPSTRLETWDYKNNAAYFITIIAKNRKHFFGEIVETPHLTTPKTMQLSEIGKIVQTEWMKTPSLRPDMNLTLGEFVVMPDHFHGIIVIGQNIYNGHPVGVIGKDDVIDVGDASHCVSTMKTHRVYVQCIVSPHKNLFSFQTKNLASIMRGFKSAVTILARKIDPSFAWQPRFHDHIIRNNKSYKIIANYIKMNPEKWIL
jgi:REP element-mobilizing transposase RayT